MMGWDWHTYKSQPAHFIQAVEYWSVKDYEESRKRMKN